MCSQGLNMKSATAFCVLFFATIALARPDDDHYTTKYDNIDLDEILNNKKVLNNYVDCLLDKGKCTAEAKELKDHMVEAMENDCAKCTEAQKKGTRHVIEFLMKNEKEIWNALKDKFDPERKYSAKYEKELQGAK